jgi:hypothetical protein
LPVSANSGVREAALNASSVGELPLGVVGVARLAERGAEDLAVAEGAALDLVAEPGVLRVALGVRFLLVDDEDHGSSTLLRPGTGRSV